MLVEWSRVVIVKLSCDCRVSRVVMEKWNWAVEVEWSPVGGVEMWWWSRVESSCKEVVRRVVVLEGFKQCLFSVLTESVKTFYIMSRGSRGLKTPPIFSIRKWDTFVHFHLWQILATSLLILLTSWKEDQWYESTVWNENFSFIKSYFAQYCVHTVIWPFLLSFCICNWM